MTFPEALIHKEVNFQFCGERLRFYLSQSLFSSFDIDQGSKLLLKTIAQHLKPAEWQSLSDVGCGTGVLGIALKKKFPRLKLVGLDRNALAVAFSRINALLNALGEDATFCGSLGLKELPGHKADCVMSNLPAKAGAPVLEMLLTDLLAAHTEAGLAVIVIVSTLSAFVEDTLERLGAVVCYKEETSEHCVFHFRRGDQAVAAAVAISPTHDTLADAEPAFVEAALLGPYLRTRKEFTVPCRTHNLTYALETAYNLPDFDTLGYQLRLAMELLSQYPLQGRGLFWNPGQGHLPVFLYASRGPELKALALASRDKLQLETSRYNLLKNGFPGENLVTAHLPYYTLLKTELTAPVDFAVFIPDSDPVQAWLADFNDFFTQLLVPGGMLVITATSSVAFHILQKLPGFTLVKDKKYHGYRSLILKSRA